MTYYYDSEAKVMIAVDPDTEDVRILEAINFEENEPELKTIKVKPAPQSVKQTGQGCSECGSKSRHRKDCSRAGGGAGAERYPTGARKPLKRAPCAECGSKGSRHKKNCSKAGQKQSLTGNDEWAKLDDETRKKLMTRMEFGRVKIAQSHDIPSETIARNMQIAEAEVKKAFKIETYDDYETL